MYEFPPPSLLPQSVKEDTLNSQPPQRLWRVNSRVRFSEDSLASTSFFSPSSEQTSLVSPTSTFVPSFEAPKDEVDNSIQFFPSPSDPSEPYAFPCSPLTRLSSSERLFPPQQPPHLSRQASSKSIAPDASTPAGGITTNVLGALREVVNRPSLGESPRHSVLLSYAPSIRESFGSIASTMLSDPGSGNQAPKEVVLPPPIIMDEATFSTLLPSAETPHDPDRVPTINRDSWQVDLGLSPRSTPSPIVVSEEVFAQSLEPDYSLEAFDESIDLSQTIGNVEMEVASREAHVDNVQSFSRPTHAAMVMESIDEEEESRMRQERFDSTLSEALEFPLPPSREGSIIQFNGSTETIHVLEADQEAKDVCPDTTKPALNCSAFRPQPAVASPPSSPRSARAIQNEVAQSPISASSLNATTTSGPLPQISPLISFRPSPLDRVGQRLNRSSSIESVQSATSLAKARGRGASESEEEGFTHAIRAIGLRKIDRREESRTLTSSGDSNTPHFAPLAMIMQRRPRAHRTADCMSRLSSGSMLSTSSSTGPMTPSVPGDAMMSQTSRRMSTSSSCSGGPGDYPWGRRSVPPSPTASIRSGRSFPSPKASFYADLSTVTPSKTGTVTTTQSMRMPPPTRKIGGWGRPEVLMDGHWDQILSEDWSDSESEMDEAEEPALPESHFGSSSRRRRSELSDRNRIVAPSSDKRDSSFDETTDENPIGTAL